jgi:hypothetical protein
MGKKIKFKTVKEELIHIAEMHGGLCSPNAVVAYAEDPHTLLHTHFTWDNDEAAVRYRLWQARQIISLELTVIEHDSLKKPVSLRMFHSLPEDRQSRVGYRLITDIMNDPIQRQQLLESAFNELTHFRLKYKGLAELHKVFSAIDEIIPEETTRLNLKAIEKGSRKSK